MSPPSFHLSKGLMAALLAGLSAGAQALVVNVSSQNDVGTSVLLDAGTYVVSLIGPSDGGAYTAWNPWGLDVNTGCDASGAACAQGWTNRFAIAIPGGAALEYGPPGSFSGGFYARSSLSLASYQAGPLNLADNVGGVSLNVRAVPEPAAAASLFAGLIMLGWLAHRSR